VKTARYFEKTKGAWSLFLPLSFRHGSILKLHATGATHHIVEVLAGHTTGTVREQVYSHRDKLPMKLLLDELAKLRYVGVEKSLRDKLDFGVI